jgi:hypothetical protein
MHKRAAMSKLASNMFSVSDVEPATTPLLEVPYKEAVEALLCGRAHLHMMRTGHNDFNVYGS